MIMFVLKISEDSYLMKAMGKILWDEQLSNKHYPQMDNTI